MSSISIDRLNMDRFNASMNRAQIQSEVQRQCYAIDPNAPPELIRSLKKDLLRILTGHLAIVAAESAEPEVETPTLDGRDLNQREDSHSEDN